MNIYAQIIKNIIFPLWLYKNGKNDLKHLKELSQSQFLSAEKIKALQWKRLSAMFEHAYNTCPFYHNRFDSLSLKPSSINRDEQMLLLPILTKTDIQNNLNDMKSNAYSEETLIRDKTGGSTGSPLVFYYDNDRLASRQAAAMRHDNWTTWHIGKKTALLWGASSDLKGFQSLKGSLRNSLLSRNIVLDTSSITEEKMWTFIRELKKYRPEYFLAYANSMAFFAKFVKEHGITGIEPKAITTSAEVLTDEDRLLIEEVFKCKVFNRYGCRELSVIASECDTHSGLHINAENLYVEFVTEGRHTKPGEIGEILITDLQNFGMPLIRYKIGDMGVPLDTACSCGRGLPMMEVAGGRVTDFIKTPSNKQISGVAVATYVVTNIPGIQQVQFIQNRIDKLIIKIVKGAEFSEETIRKLNANIEKFIGTDIGVDYEYVDSIPLTASGKYRFSICNLDSQSENEETK